MTTFLPGEIVLVTFPFTVGTHTTRRPALIELDAGDEDVVVARITTRPYRTLHDLAVSDWRGAGLRAPSYIRVHKLATLHRSLIDHRLGRLIRNPGDYVANSMWRSPLSRASGGCPLGGGWG